MKIFLILGVFLFVFLFGLGMITEIIFSCFLYFFCMFFMMFLYFLLLVNFFFVRFMLLKEIIVDGGFVGGVVIVGGGGGMFIILGCTSSGALFCSAWRTVSVLLFIVMLFNF